MSKRSVLLANYLERELGFQVYETPRYVCTAGCGYTATQQFMHCVACGNRMKPSKENKKHRRQTHIELEAAIKYALGEK